MGLWRTLISSSLGTTAYPYCRYIRVLDLNDLGMLLEDQRFRNTYQQQFFDGDLTQFLVEYDTAAVTRAKRLRRLNAAAVVQKVGDILTEHTPMVQELAGSIDSSSLTRWLPRLRHLQRLRLWDGPEVDGIAPLLCEHCHSFRALMFYQARAEQSDQVLAKFLLDLKENTFQSFEVAGSLTADDAIFAAFNHHATSLTELKLEDLPGNAMLNLSQMSSCTALKTLHIKLHTMVDSAVNTDAFTPKIVSWLRRCKDLRDVSLDAGLDSGDLFPKVLTPLLLDNDVHLSRLSVSNYNSGQAVEFHRAIANQAPSLSSLYLRADGEVCDVHVLVQSLRHLHNLQDMRLQNISDFFQDRHVVAIAKSMRLLEELWISGWDISDAIWPHVNSLRHLRRLEINAYSLFTFEGVLDFITGLSDEQRGFYLAIMMANPTTELARNEEEQTLLRETIAAKLEGRFEFTLARGMGCSTAGGSETDMLQIQMQQSSAQTPSLTERKIRMRP